MPAILIENGGERRSLLFSFVPKTGGTALIDFFAQSGARAFLHDENNDLETLLRCPTQHLHYEILDTLYRLDDFDFAFTVVRNPVDRAKSDYLWSYRDLRQRDLLPSFDHWFETITDRFGHDPFALDNHVRPQHEFVGPGITRIYRYEDGLEAVVLDIYRSLSIEPLPPITGHFVPRRNTAEQHFGKGVKSQSVTMSGETMQRLSTFYREDFERFYPHCL